MSRAGCGTPASILFKRVTNKYLVYQINKTVVMIGTFVENKGLDAPLEEGTNTDAKISE